MAKMVRTLDTPFRKGERVQTTCDLDDLATGTSGKIKLANGLGNWRRYWVMFEGGEVRGQVSHEQLVRPAQLEEWQQREEDRQNAELASATAVEETAEVSAGDDSGATGLAALVPAHLLERSQAAKARLAG